MKTKTQLKKTAHNKLVVLLFITFWIQVSLTVRGQTRIPISEIQINGKEIYTGSKSQIINDLGAPTEIQPYFFEMENSEGELLIYNGLEIYILDNQFDSFILTGGSYTFSKHNIKIGDPINKLGLYYPESYDSKDGNNIILYIEKNDSYIWIEAAREDSLKIGKISLYVY